MSKKLLIVAFINKNKSDNFLKYIEEEFNISPSKAFKFEIEGDNYQCIFTFYIELEIGENINLRDYFRNALIVNKKSDVFYTINGLNKLIEKEYNLESGNINYRTFKIDWSKFKNNLILSSNNNLSIIQLKRVFS
jgi:hypothetical protein|tara:strand:+ start:6691 stop:7095 length:405 start_codon:yes stop_codon:yes gene_type:complete